MPLFTWTAGLALDYLESAHFDKPFLRMPRGAAAFATGTEVALDSVDMVLKIHLDTPAGVLE